METKLYEGLDHAKEMYIVAYGTLDSGTFKIICHNIEPIFVEQPIDFNKERDIDVLWFDGENTQKLFAQFGCPDKPDKEKLNAVTEYLNKNASIYMLRKHCDINRIEYTFDFGGGYDSVWFFDD